MYPYLRTWYHLRQAKKKSPMATPFEECKIKLQVWPWDIDPFMELNNGRFLTLMDIGRFEFGERIGLPKVLKKNNWGLMVGAVSTRYRRRLKPFEKFTLHTQLLYYDYRWFYFHQWFSTNDERKIHASFLVRTAAFGKDGLVPTNKIVKALDFDESQFEDLNIMTPWIEQWIKSDEIHKEIMEEHLVK